MAIIMLSYLHDIYISIDHGEIYKLWFGVP